MNQGATISDSGMLEIKNVPTGLILYAVQQWLPCQKYAKASGMHKNTNTFIKAISVWLILKSETSSGKIKQYRSQLQLLAAKCKMSVRTLEKYINWLRAEQLATVDKRDLILETYKALRRYEISLEERLPTIQYNINDETNLSEILITIAFMKYKERWSRMYWKKMKQNPDRYKLLYDVLAQFYDATRLQDPEYFRECHLDLLKKTFQHEKPGHSEIFQLLHEELNANPDLNARADTYAYKLGYGHAMSFVHLKYRLESKGLISFYMRVIEGENRAHKDESTYHVRWLKQQKHTVWFMCDRIEILAEKFLKNRAA